MTNRQWQRLLDIIQGKSELPLTAGFIIDSPWLPQWAGITILDYFTSEQKWLEANLRAVRQFPDVMFLPGFWSEFGMCTEPSAFGAKSVWSENAFPHPAKMTSDIDRLNNLARPNPQTDGLCPFVLKRLQHSRSEIQKAGHGIKFAVSRGPLNIASFVMGTTEFLLALKTDPEKARKLIGTITDFICDWLETQQKAFPSIDGVFILDDIVGFLGEQDFKSAVLPRLKKIFNYLDVKVKFFHNDSSGLVCAPSLPETGVNLFNFSFKHTIEQMKELTGNSVTLLGNIPPVDVLAEGTPKKVKQAVKSQLNTIQDKRRIIMSCGGGMPPGVSTQNIKSFISALQ